MRCSPAFLVLCLITSCSQAPAPPPVNEAGAPDLRLDAPGDLQQPDILQPDLARPDLLLADLAAADLGPDHGPVADAGPACPAGKWCSSLYPPGWTATSAADSKGRYLHDFSYAGYHRGEKKLPATAPGKVVDVVKDHGADNTGKVDATAAMQQGIDAVVKAGGGVVSIPAGTYRLDGVLKVASSGVVLRGDGPAKTKLHFTSHKGMSHKGHITFQGKVTRGADMLLAADARARSKVAVLKGAASLKPGDEVSLGWVITTDFVKAHGMTGYWKPFYNQWKPVFRRTVTAVDRSIKPHRVTLDIPLRYDALTRDKASLRKESGYLSECGVEELGLSNAVKWKEAWANDQVHVLKLNQVKDCWVRNVASVPSPGATGWTAGDKTPYHLQSSGVRITDSKRVTVSKTQFKNPQHRGGGGNGYLIHITRSNEVLVADSSGKNGRHNLIQNWDFGTTGCVFLRCVSSGSTSVTMVAGFPVAIPALSEYHHALAMGNLVDSCQLDDGWMAANRLSWSSGAGHTSTGCAFWNTTGGGTIQSMQYGWGYVIGTGPKVKVNTSLLHLNAAGSKPEDFVEGKGKAASLWPQSLYEHQRADRLGP